MARFFHHKLFEVGTCGHLSIDFATLYHGEIGSIGGVRILSALCIGCRLLCIYDFHVYTFEYVNELKTISTTTYSQKRIVFLQILHSSKIHLRNPYTAFKRRSCLQAVVS